MGLSNTRVLKDAGNSRWGWTMSHSPLLETSLRSHASCVTPQISDQGSIKAVWSDPPAQKIRLLHLSSEIPLLFGGERKHIQQRHKRSTKVPRHTHVLLVMNTIQHRCHEPTINLRKSSWLDSFQHFSNINHNICNVG